MRSMPFMFWVLAAGATSACGLDGDSEERGSVRSAITGGVPDDEDAVVAIARDGGRLCTGALIAPDVVLTARHCVSKTNGLSSRCTADGEETGGARFLEDEAPSSLRIFVGPKPDPRTTPAAVGKKALYAAASSPCNADLAVLVLDRAVAGASSLAVRLRTPTRTGERLRAVGYGRTESGSIGERLRRDDLRVLASGPTMSASKTALGARELETTQSFCDGDSGGPALSLSAAIVGVVSRGPDCTEPHGYVYTTVRGFGAVLDEAAKLTGSSFAFEAGDAEALAEDAGALEGGAGARPSDAGVTRSTTSYDRGLPQRCAYAVGGRSNGGATLLIVIVIATARRARRRVDSCDGRTT